jgi:hypothetical protein
MNREDFKAISAQLKKGSRVRVKLASSRSDVPDEFDAKIYDRGPSYIEVGIKKVRGLRRFLFTQLESIEAIEVPENATANS